VLREQLMKTEKQRMSTAADRAESAYWLHKAELMDAAVAATEAAEAAEKELASLTDQGALDQRVGMLLFTKGLVSLFPFHGGELRSPDMLVRLKEMRNLHQLGVDATDRELHALLKELDMAGDGKLSLKGLNAAIKRSHGAMMSTQAKIKEVGIGAAPGALLSLSPLVWPYLTFAALSTAGYA
jgi:hypothetical protein